MRWSQVFLAVISLIFIALLFFYWVIPTDVIEFGEPKSSNFNLNETLGQQMQFYENMRFETPRISYRVDSDCTLSKRGEMEEAFEMVENLTILEFYPVVESEQILVSCQSKNKVKEGMFIAGEGGPVNITGGENFNVIYEGQILLIKNSNCERPNVQIHELLHVLGFNHSENSNNIMYPVSKCKQTIGEDMIEEINRLYSYEALPDLKFKSANARIDKISMDLNVTIMNDGLKRAEKSNLAIYADSKKIKNIEIDPLGIGYEVRIGLRNILISKLNVDDIKLTIESNFTELSLDNNNISLTKTNESS